MLIFQKVWRSEQNFLLAQKVSPQSSPDRDTLFKIAALHLGSD